MRLNILTEKLWVIATLTFVLINPAFAGNKKVLLVGMDGVQYRYIDQLATPGFDRLHITKAYAGGVTSRFTEQATSSGPGWSTILTGVWVNKHGVSNNNVGPADRAWPSVFRFIHNANPSAKLYSFATWGTMNTLYFPYDMPLLTARSEGGGDDKSTNLALEVLQNDNPDFIFIHLDEPDGAGHNDGWGPVYEQSITDSDARLSKLLDEVDRRERQLKEDWLVLVVTDHGREPRDGYSHGGQSASEKTIFIASSEPLNDEYKKYASVFNEDYDGLYHYPGQTYVVPTILEFLGINSAKGYLDGLPLLGTIDTTRIHSVIAEKACGFEWSSVAGKPRELAPTEHLAKFDCEGNTDPFLIQGEYIYVNIYGSSCGFQWNSIKGVPRILGANEHIAKFDCSAKADALNIDDKFIYSTIQAEDCGLEWHAQSGEPGTVNANEHVAKFDCDGNADSLIFE